MQGGSKRYFWYVLIDTAYFCFRGLGFISEDLYTGLEIAQQERWEWLCPKFLHVCSSLAAGPEPSPGQGTRTDFYFPRGQWTGGSLRPSVSSGTGVLHGAGQSWPLLHQGALPTVGKTTKGQLWRFSLLLFPLMEKAEHSWVSSSVLPTSVTHKSSTGHAKSCHLGLLGLLCF